MNSQTDEANIKPETARSQRAGEAENPTESGLGTMDRRGRLRKAKAE